jgi:hypothetical protein
MTRKPSTLLLVALGGGALVAGCGSSVKTPSTSRTIRAAGTTLITATTTTPTTAKKTPGGAVRRVRESPQKALKRLEEECTQKRKVAPKLSVAQNQETCKQLGLIP